MALDVKALLDDAISIEEDKNPVLYQQLASLDEQIRPLNEQRRALVAQISAAESSALKLMKRQRAALNDLRFRLR